MSDSKSSTSKRNKKLSTAPTFHLFPELPVELRLVIWKLAANIQRVVMLEHRPGGYDNAGPGRDPEGLAILAANRESRETAQPFFKKHKFRTSAYNPHRMSYETKAYFYFLNGDDDIFYAHCGLIIPRYNCSHPIKNMGLTETIQRLALPINAKVNPTRPVGDSERLSSLVGYRDFKRGCFWKALAKHFPNLKEMSFVFTGTLEELFPVNYNELTEYWDSPSLTYLEKNPGVWSHALPEHEVMDFTIASLYEAREKRGILGDLKVKFLRRKDWLITHSEDCGIFGCPSAACQNYPRGTVDWHGNSGEDATAS